MILFMQNNNSKHWPCPDTWPNYKNLNFMKKHSMELFIFYDLLHKTFRFFKKQVSPCNTKIHFWDFAFRSNLMGIALSIPSYLAYFLKYTSLLTQKEKQPNGCIIFIMPFTGYDFNILQFINVIDKTVRFIYPSGISWTMF